MIQRGDGDMRCFLRRWLLSLNRTIGNDSAVLTGLREVKLRIE